MTDGGTIEEIFPLSPMQQGLLFHSVSAADSTAYTVQVCCTVEGELDPVALASAWRTVIALHPVLRSDFDWEELDEPVQVVHLSLEVPVERREGALAEFLAEDRRCPFQLSAAPLLRLTLLREAGLQHLVWTYHHILLDGWSALLVLGQLFAAYRAVREGGALRLDSPRRFSEYVAWLRQLDLGSAEAIWRRELRGFREPTPLPVRPAQGGERHGFGRSAVALAPDLLTRLRAFARRHRLTLNTLVQGAWALVLARVSGEEDLLFGAAVAGRPPELGGSESMVGLFLNTLPVRVRVPPAALLAPWLAELQAGQLALRPAHHAPLAAIQTWSELPRDRPLFESVLIFENHPVSGALQEGADGIAVQSLRFSCATHYPLALTALPGATLDLEIGFDAGRIEGATAWALLTQLRNLLATLGEHGETPLDSLPALSPAERHQVLRECNDTAEERSRRTLHRWFEGQAARSPDAVAVVSGGRSLTYAQLNAAANRLARHLLGLGIARGEPVAVCLARSERVPVALLAVLKAGGAYVPLDPTHPPERLAAMLAGSRARFVLTEAAHARPFPASLARLDLDELGSALAGESEEDLDLTAGPEDLAYVIFTSGSTGQPKGVAVPHGAVVNLLADFARRLALGPGRSLLAVTTFSFDIAGLELFLPLVTGARVILAPSEAAGDGRLLARLLAEGADVVQATPSTWFLLLAAGWQGDLRLTLLCGGEALPRPLADRLLRCGAALYNLYGPTETTIWSLVARVEAGEGAVPIGRPLANTRVYLLDAHLQPLPAGLPGELYLGGGGLARGYFGLPAETAERFVPDPWGGEPGGRLYRTGDRVRRRLDGELEFLGRVDHQAKVRGFRVEPGEIEALLVRHPGIREAAVAARRDEDGGARLVAYLVPGEVPLSASALSQFLRERLPEPLVPSAFVFLPALPRTANEKVDRRSLPDPGRERPAVETVFHPPRTAVEERLARIWGAVLKLDRVGVFDNFFELGGDSIRSVQVVARAAQEGLRLTPDQIFARRTIAALAEIAGTEEDLPEEVDGGFAWADRDTHPPSAEIEALYPVSSIQQGMLFHSLLAPGSAVYFEQVACTLRGAFHAPLFHRAWKRAVERHPVLRSAFRWEAGEPGQAVFRRVELPWRSEDLRGFAAAERFARLEDILAEDRRLGFDPERAPLSRHVLIRLSADAWRWFWSFHHALLDGWSVALLLREVFAIYAGLCRGEVTPMPEPPAPDGYFAWLERRDRRAEEAYWRGYLAGLSTPTVLDLGGGQEAGEAGYGRQEIHLQAEETRSLLGTARRAGLTLHTVLQGAWALLIARYSGEAEVVFGTTSAGRPAELPGAESLIGLFVSTLPARVRVPATAEPLAWLQELQQRQAEMRGFERTSLTEIQGWSEVPRGVPLFECVEVLENYPSDPVPERGLDGLQVSDLSLFERTNYPLSFMALPGPRLVLRLLYDRPRFEDGAMARMAGHLANLVQGLLAEPGRLADLPMLGEGERQQVLLEWNDAGAPAGEGTVLDLFALQAARTPGALAVQEGDRELTYGELDWRSSRLAGSLAGRGIRPGDVVVLSFHPGIEMVVGALGVVRAGAAYLPLDPETPAERLRMLLADSGAKTLIAADLNAEEPGGGCARPDPAQTAYVVYTSGSTGRPKGVAVGHAALLNLVRWHLRTYDVRADDRMSLFANPAFDAAVWEIWPVLACGASLHAVPREVRGDPARLIPWLGERRISICFLPTPLAELAVELPWPPDPALRVLLTGGDRLQRGSARPLPFQLVNHYGPTEAAVVTTAARVEPGPAAGPPPIGRPIANAAVHLLGPGLDPVPLGTPGELFIGGAVLAQGYLGRPDLTAAAFFPDPFSAVPGARLYRTGDRARRRADGQLDFLGRLDRQVKVRGVRIEPREIETVLLGRPGVRQAVTLVREDRPGDRRLVAYVTAEPPAAAGREELRGDLVASWRELYDETYGGAPAADPGFDIVGWRSSYGGEPIPPEQMREWVERTVERILSLRPRRVLEIGCGTGLLLFRLAPRCERYCGTDFSRPALDSIARQLGRAGLELPGLTLLERRADDLSGLAAEGFDLVILNSVVQYFPDEGYLERVLTAAAGIVGPGGAIFVGDVRSLPLLPAYCASVERFHAAADLSLPELRRRVEQRVAEEEELVVDPRFFAAVAERIPGLGGAEVLLKPGRSANELVRYRYDALLRAGERKSPEDVDWIDWEENFDLPRLRRILIEDRPPSLALSRVPDARVSADLALLGALVHGEAGEAVDPEDLWKLGRESSYTVWAGWSVSAAPGAFDVIFRRAGSAGEPGAILQAGGEGGASRFTNDPLAARARQRLLSGLREDLRQALPNSMVPAEIVLLETLPVTPHGKVDLAALPPPVPRPSQSGASLPREPLEVELAALWSEVLGVEAVARDQSFFELGGHSLLAIRLISRVREALGIELTVASLFSAPTVAGMAEGLRQRNRGGGTRDQELPSNIDERHLPFPLTPVQRGLWENRSETAVLAGGANVCFELAAVDLDGVLVDRLNAALERLVARHEMLRAVVRADGRQEILSSVPACPVTVDDLRGLPPEEVASRRAAVREAFQNRVGQAGRWPLFELVAHRLDGGELRLHAWFDALILDGPSREIFCHELNRLIEDPAAALPPVSCSYRDYALAAVQQSDRTARDGPGLPSPLLPAGDVGRVPVVDRFAQLLDPRSWAALRAEAVTVAVTPSALALGVFVELLARWNASPGFTLGLVSAYRPPVHPEVDRVIGNFTRLVPLVVSCWEGAFAERLNRLQERLSASLDDRWRGGGDIWPPVLFNSLLETSLPPFAPGAGARLETVEVGAYWPGTLLVATVAEDAAGSLVCKWQAREASLPVGLGESLFEDHATLWRRLAAAGVLDRSAGYNTFSFFEVPAGA